jgi:hypothetical protein
MKDVQRYKIRYLFVSQSLPGVGLGKQIANPQILGVIPLSQIFMINP